MNTSQAQRLAGCLALLESPVRGEVVAAAAAATRLLRNAGFRWPDLAAPLALLSPEPLLADSMPPNWRMVLRWCLEQLANGGLTAWESAFVVESSRVTRPTVRQLEVPAEIERKLRTRRGMS
jgi:hypothetical protein